jgi:purine-binding chemotaxis protein CheW
LTNVVETMRPLPIEPLANMPPFVLGLAVIRGVPVPVVDLGAIVAARSGRSTSRFVTLRLGKRSVALAVDAVVGVRGVSPESLGQMPPLLRDADANFVHAIGTLDAELLVALGSTLFLDDSVWKAIDGKGLGA